MNERRSELVKETEGTVMINEEMIERAAKAIRSTADAFFNGREVDQITSVKSAKQAFDRLYRQQARAALQAAAVPAGDDVDLTTAYMTGYLAGKDDAAAIAAFEEVLLSDEVVEAAAKGMWDSDMEAESDSHIPWDECGPHQEPWREEERHQARAALQAALAAAKGTEGSE